MKTRIDNAMTELNIARSRTSAQNIIKEGKVTVNGKTYDTSITDGISEAPKASNGEGEEIKAGLPGNVLRIEVSAGDTVNEGDVLLVMEAMKMETEIKSPVSGTVNTVEVELGSKVKTGDVLVTIG